MGTQLKFDPFGMSDGFQWKTAEFTTDVFGHEGRVDVRIMSSYATAMEFNVLATSYVFSITKWRSNALSKFKKVFHTIERDREYFGYIHIDSEEEDMDGNPVESPIMTADQTVNAIVQACHDVMKCLMQIAYKHKNGMLGYAVWFLNQKRPEDTYIGYIANLTCKLIIDSDFLAPDIEWKEVEFDINSDLL